MDLKLGINLKRTIATDFIIVELFGVCPVSFPFREKGFSTLIFVFLCVTDILA